MKLWVCIPVHNRVQVTLRCMTCLASQRHLDYAVIVCDDGSTDGTAEAVRRSFPDTIVLVGDGNLWWTGGINRCVEYALEQAGAGDAVVILNDDLEVEPDYLERLSAAAARHPGAIITSPVHDLTTRRPISKGFRQNWVTTKMHAVNPAVEHLPDDPDVAAVTHAYGRGTLIPVQVFHRIGLFDEKHLPHYAADADFAHHARRAGHGILVCVSAPVFSHDAAGRTGTREKASFRGLRGYLTDRRSPANLRARWWFAVRNCPKTLLPSFVLLDVMFVIGSYFRTTLSLRRSPKEIADGRTLKSALNGPEGGQ